MSTNYGPPEEGTTITLLRDAVDRGQTFFAKTKVCGPFSNGELVGEGIAPVREKVVIATKFGFDINHETGERSGKYTSKPAHIGAVVEQSPNACAPT